MKRKVLFLAVSSLFADAALGQVVSTGATTGSSVTTGQHTTVSQGTQRAIFDWSSFNIRQTESVTFSQPNSTSIAVNRISGGRTTIDGGLNANGHVMLLNQNGVLFSSTAIVNVGSLTASTGRLATTFTDEDFILPANNAAPIAIIGATSGSIENRGVITATAGSAGLVAFVAPSVINSGTIRAVGGRIRLAGAEEATISLNNGLYEMVIDKGSADSNAKVENLAGGTLTTVAENAQPSDPVTGSIMLSVRDAFNVVSGVINLSGVQQASLIEVHGGVVTLKSDLNAATVTGTSATINVSDSGKLQDAVDIAKVGTPGAGARVNVNGGAYEEQVRLNKANMTFAGNSGAKITVPNSAEVNGVTITANNVTFSGFEIAGPVTSSYLTYPWGPNISRGIFVMNGVTGFNIANNNIHDIRNGILIDGRNTGSVTGNRIENTKSGISVQYTDASGIAISGNSEGPIGNEWGVNLHLNGHLDTGGNVQSNSIPLASAPTLTWQQALLDLGSANGGWAVQDQAYTSSNRTRVTVATTGSSSSQGSALTPINTIQGGINAVVTGGYVNVKGGTYAENLSITKALTLRGAGAGQSIIAPTSSNAIDVSGTIGVTASVVIDGFTFRGATYGVQVAGATVLGNLTVQNSDFLGNIKNGFFVNGNSSSGAPGLTNVYLLNDTFEHNGAVNPNSLGWGDILFNFYNGNATLSGLRIHGGGEYNGIQMRGSSPTPNTPRNAGSIAFNDVIIDGDFLRPAGSIGTFNPSGPGAAMHLLEYASVANVSFTDVKLAPTIGHGLFIEGIGSTLNIGNTNFGTPDSTPRGTSVDPTHPQQVSRNILAGSNSNNLLTYADARAAKFNDVAVSGMTTDQLFGIEDRITDALDRSGLGLVRLKTNNIYVTGASGSIQRGIDAACTCDTVHVGAGTFAEQLTINKSLILVGAGADQTFIAPTSLAADNLAMKSIVTVGGGASTSVDMSGFTIKGPVAEINAGVFVRDGAFAHIFNNKLIDIRESIALSGVQRGLAILVGRAALNTSGRALIENNIITGYQKGGIVVDGPGSMATILGNTVTGEGATTATAQNGIQVSRGASAHIEGNTVSGNRYTPLSDEATGILIFTPGTNLALNQGEITVGPNNVTDNEVGVWTNDPRSLTRVNLSGVTGNTREAVADFGGGYAGQGGLLEYPAWAASSSANVSAGAFGGKLTGDIVGVDGTLRVSGWSGFSAIQPAVNTVATGATINVDGGTYAESVALNRLLNLRFNGTTIQGLTINAGAANSGIGGSVTANGGTGFLFNAPVRLLSDARLVARGGNIVLNGDIQGDGGNAYALSLDAGGGNVSMVTGGTQANPLGHLDVAANNFNLSSTLYVSGYDIDALGSVALADHTLVSLGALLSLISAGGNVTGSTISQGSVTIAGGGDVITNIISLGNVAIVATNVGGNITGGFIVLGAQNEVNANVNALQVVEIQAGGQVNLSGSAPSLVLNAQGGNASGNFGNVTNSGSGVVSVNGVPQPNVRVSEITSAQQFIPTKVVTAGDAGAGSPNVGTTTISSSMFAAAGVAQQPEQGLQGAAERLRRGESVEIDLTPGNN